MKVRNKYKIRLCNRPGISITVANKKPKSESIGKWISGLLFLILIPFVFSVTLQFLQQKVLRGQALLFVPDGQFSFLAPFILIILTAFILMAVWKRQNYIQPVFLILCIVVVLMTQAFYVKVNPDNISIRNLVWQKAYQWSDLRNAVIHVSSFPVKPHLDYSVFTADGKKIDLNPSFYLWRDVRGLTEADALMTEKKVSVILIKLNKSLVEKLTPEEQRIIVRHNAAQ